MVKMLNADLGQVSCVRDCRVQYVINIYRKQLEKSLRSRRRHCIHSIIRRCPRVRSIRESAVRKMVDDALVRVLLRAHEDQTA